MLHFHLSIFLRLTASPGFEMPLIKFFAPSSSPCSELMTHSSRFRCSTLNLSLLKSVSYDTMRPHFANKISWVIWLELFTISSMSVLVTLRLCMSISSEIRGNNTTMLSTNSPSSNLNSEIESTMSKFKTRPLISCLIHHLSRSLISWQSSGAFKNIRTRHVKSYNRSRKCFIFKFINLFHLMEGRRPESGIIFPSSKANSL